MGQRGAAGQDWRNHPVESVDPGEALTDGRGACEACFPDYQPIAGVPKPCRVRDNDSWVSGTLLRWQQRADRRWDGLVGYAVAGDVVTRVGHQDDLRPAEPH